ncbi:MAG: hypothetical protein J4G01_08640, partial [Dehalococcoidia bacterium]|nr:hypothetical protein [Dehalococcoidia bacterium]
QAALPEPVVAMIASAPSVGAGERRCESASPQILECISAESVIRISGEVMANGLYADSEESHSCIVEFALEHSHYIDLVRQYSEQSETLAAEDFLEIAEDGFKVFSCLTDDELAQFQIAHAQNLVP